MTTTEETWRCFHCGFTTSDVYEAAAHFGDRDEEKPICRTWADLNADGRLQEYQSTQRELTSERDETGMLRSKVEGLEFQVEGQRSEIHSFAPFRQRDTIQQVFNIYDSMEGRALLAEENLNKARTALQKIIEHVNDCEECAGGHIAGSPIKLIREWAREALDPREASKEQFDAAQRKTTEQHRGLFERLAA